jgi:segregation and condensation protein B
VTRPEIDEIRGVDCGPVLGTLLDRGFVRMIGKKEEVGRPILYGTTPEFLRTFSLRDLSELPTLREFHELSEDHLDEVARVDGEAAGAEGGVGEGDATAVAPPPAKAAAAARRELEPDEDDALLSELERASAAAAKAAEVPPERSPEHPPEHSVDEPAGSAE